jgi:hypothetical protein
MNLDSFNTNPMTIADNGDITIFGSWYSLDGVSLFERLTNVIKLFLGHRLTDVNLTLTRPNIEKIVSMKYAYDADKLDKDVRAAREIGGIARANATPSV